MKTVGKWFRDERGMEELQKILKLDKKVCPEDGKSAMNRLSCGVKLL